VLTLSLALLFVPVIALRLVALRGLMRVDADRNNPTVPRVADSELPIYTVLVPLYREAHMLPGLIQALTELDWPAAKLDIQLVLESSDRETIEAAAALPLPGNVEIIVVPELDPRTKPKALNYALPLARGEYLVIYDAEDWPERDQLRRAFHAFRSGPPTSPPCRRSSISIMLGTIDSPGSSPSNIAPCSTGFCRHSTGWICLSRSAEAPIIFACRH
jgi:cellulose synthase/poly-beta-1,6-N-acetylglucosamine synthase-like glycosyltransferase